MASKRVRVVVAGGVQGVGFRWYCREEAQSRGLSGAVRNRPDGRVEAVFEGAPSDVDALVAWCRRGPPSSRVEAVDVCEESPTGETGFSIDR